MEKVEVLKVERRYEGFLSVDEATVRYERPDGTMSEETTRQCVERGDAVSILLHNVSRDRLILVRQFRYAGVRHGDPFPIEIVAGAIDEGESPETAARREALEETGYRVKTLHFIQRFLTSPGVTSEMLHVFHAEVRDEDHVGGFEQHGEDIEREEITPEEAWRRLDAGEFHDAKTIVALMGLRRRAGG
jgi:ADP-ribose pyrophosphatase